MTRLSKLPAPLPIFGPPQYRVMVRWHVREEEQALTAVATLEEAQAWLQDLKKARPHTARVEPIGGRS